MPPAISVHIPPLGLTGDLRSPPDPSGLVIFAHGSGSSRLSPRNQEVAQSLCDAGLATLLFDLLTETEARDRGNVFDVALLGQRLVQTIDWAHEQPEMSALPIGLFGASTGAAAALAAAAQRPSIVKTVVSRGGRPDLAETSLPRVRQPTLLIVGGRDDLVLGLNRRAQKLLAGPSRLEVVPGAGHLFEEGGALQAVIRLASAWFSKQLGVAAPPGSVGGR